MGSFIISLLFIIVGVVMIKYREAAANNLGSAEWMRYVGGVYNFMILLGTILIFYGLARITGTTDIFLAPLVKILPI